MTIFQRVKKRSDDSPHKWVKTSLFVKKKKENPKAKRYSSSTSRARDLRNALQMSQEESTATLSLQSQLMVDPSMVLEDDSLPPPHRFKKNANSAWHNQNDIRRINAYKLALRREIAKIEFDLWRNSDLYQTLQTANDITE